MKNRKREAGQETMSTGSPKPKRRFSIFTLLLDLIIIGLIAGGSYLLLKPMYIAWRQDQVMLELAKVVENEASIDDPEGIWVDPYANAIEGEAWESFGDNTEPDTSGSTQNTAAIPEKVKLEPLGKLQIDSIEMNLPLLRGAKIIPLRYGAGWYEASAPIGGTGRATILGHSMAVNQRFFSRLPDVKVGESVRIVEAGQVLTYEIYDIRYIPEERLGEFLIQPKVASEIMLVTCFNKPAWDQRLLVFAKLVDVNPI
ncbi:MAG: sortase [Clostridia bacterium]|nr:sortase [Clostridia bacterium]